MIAPVFEDLAATKARDGIGFTKVDLDIGLGSAVASEWGVRVTPTFLFFLDGKKACGIGIVLYC
jgi:thiol-disulfide isomerase/thioredoxin